MLMDHQRYWVGLHGGKFGIPHPQRSGVASLLVDQYGFKLVSFTTVVEEVAQKIYAWDGKKDHNGLTLLNTIVTYGHKIDPSYWLNLTVASLSQDTERVVFDELWFEKEAEFIHASGGLTCKFITNPAYQYAIDDSYFDVLFVDADAAPEKSVKHLVDILTKSPPSSP